MKTNPKEISSLWMNLGTRLRQSNPETTQQFVECLDTLLCEKDFFGKRISNIPYFNIQRKVIEFALARGIEYEDALRLLKHSSYVRLRNSGTPHANNTLELFADYIATC